MEKVKLMCSYGGKIQRRPHDRQLSYVGGHTKILTVDRNINFSNLLSKLHNLCDYHSDIRLKYKLPGEELDALISVFEDEDVRQMMFEYDLLRRLSTNPARLRLFIFFSAAATPVASRLLNPDFLFGFDKEFSFNYAAEIPENTDSVAIPPRNVGSDPGRFPGIMPGDPDDYNYRAPFVYRVPVGYNVGNRELPVVYNLIPVMPSAAQESPKVPIGVHPTVMMAATCNHDSKGAIH